MPYTAFFSSVSLILIKTRWHIHAGDADAARVVVALGEAMSLPPVIFPAEQRADEQWREVRVFVDPGLSRPVTNCYESGPVFCFLPPPKNNDMLVINMSSIALAIAHAELLSGGLLVHGALAEVPDHLEGGIILAGPGTVGKTTASNRLPLPWRSLSDDTSLVVRDDRGQYMVHPWPTWSRFFSTQDGKPGSGGKWDVQSGLPLQAIFFLSQAEEDRITPVPVTPAIAYLMETVQHVSWIMTQDLPVDQAQALHGKQLAAAEELVRTIPAYTLHLSLTGAFWKRIEETLASKDIVSPTLSDHAPSSEDRPEHKENISQSFFFDDTILTVSYSGASMNPTLRHFDLLQVIPYAGKPVRRGDVVYFQLPMGGLKVVHRVVRITADGICTRGDNNLADDPYLLQQTDIIGQVTAALRHEKLRKIAGGLQGIKTGYAANLHCRLNKFFSPMLHGFYHGLAASGFLRYLLPASMQPRVFEFKQRYLPSILKLLVNGHVIGHNDVRTKRWVIDRPWKLIIDETKLPDVSESSSREPANLNNTGMKNTIAKN